MRNLAAVLSVLACSAAAQQLTHAVSVTVIDKVTSKRLPGVRLVLRTPQGELKGITSEHGHVQWNTDTEPNVVLRGKPFEVLAWAPGYLASSRKCIALPKTDSDSIAWVCYQISLEPVSAAQSRPPTEPAKARPDEWLEYEFVDIKQPTVDDEDHGMIFLSTCYIDGVPVGVMQGPHTANPQQTFPTDIGASAKAILTLYGYEFVSDTVAKCAQTVVGEIGRREIVGFEGREFFRMHTVVITWKVSRHFRDDPRVEFVEERTTELVTGCYVTFGPPERKDKDK